VFDFAQLSGGFYGAVVTVTSLALLLSRTMMLAAAFRNAVHLPALRSAKYQLI
jgi:hypothetical protein